MKPERWREITDIFEAALRRDPASLPGYLGEACADDKELQREVEALLAAHEQAANFIEELALAVAANRYGDDHSRR